MQPCKKTYRRHARSAIGTNILPFGTPVEIEMIVEVDEEEI